MLLDGLKVLEVGEMIAAPYAGKLLADLGADVLKIEPPSGDAARRCGPFPGDEPDGESSGLFIYLNANKRSLTLDLSSVGSNEVLRQLVPTYDVVLESVDSRTPARDRVSYEALRTAAPAVIVTSISTFGRSGPRASWGGGGLIASAASTVAHRMGEPDRYPLGKPCGEEEFLGGVHAAAATLAAVLFRDNTGDGQHVDISLQDLLATVASGTSIVGSLFGASAAPGRTGSRSSAFYPWGIVKVGDGHFEICSPQERHWQEFVKYLGDPAWASDPRFETRLTRVIHGEEIDSHLVEEIGSKTKAALWEDFKRRRLPFQPVHRVDEVVDSGHVRETGGVQEVVDGQGRPLRLPASPYRLTNEPIPKPKPAPRLGEHNGAVLHGELGLTPEEISDLRRAGVI